MVRQMEEKFKTFAWLDQDDSLFFLRKRSRVVVLWGGVPATPVPGSGLLVSLFFHFTVAA